MSPLWDLVLKDVVIHTVAVDVVHILIFKFS